MPATKLSDTGEALRGTVFRVSTCNNDPACSFTRTVLAVPEPGTLVMVAIGLAALVGGRRPALRAP